MFTAQTVLCKPRLVRLEETDLRRRLRKIDVYSEERKRRKKEIKGKNIWGRGYKTFTTVFDAVV
jgi:hypothetical protein